MIDLEPFKRKAEELGFTVPESRSVIYDEFILDAESEEEQYLNSMLVKHPKLDKAKVVSWSGGGGLVESFERTLSGLLK